MQTTNKNFVHRPPDAPQPSSVLRNASTRATHSAQTLFPPNFVPLGEFCSVRKGCRLDHCSQWVTDADTSLVPLSLTAPIVMTTGDLARLQHPILEDATSLRRIVLLPADLSGLNVDEQTAAEEFLSETQSNRTDRRLNTGTAKFPHIQPPAPLLLPSLAQRPPVFVRNHIRAFHSQVVLGIYPDQALSSRAQNVLCRSLTSAIAGATVRVYGDGARKYEPSDVQRLLVPDPETLQDCVVVANI